MSINKVLLFSHVHSCTYCPQLCLHSICRAESMSRSHIAQTLKCLPPGALQMKLLAFRLWDGFSACNICKMAMLWLFLLHSSGRWLAALCHFAFPLHEPHIKCEEGRSSEIINFQFKCRGSKVYFFPPRSFLIASGQGSLSGSNLLPSLTAGTHCVTRGQGTHRPLLLALDTF